jgi:hypothetical protein
MRHLISMLASIRFGILFLRLIYIIQAKIGNVNYFLKVSVENKVAPLLEVEARNWGAELIN